MTYIISSEARAEREHWDQAAAVDPRRAVWDEPTYDETRCLTFVLGFLGPSAKAGRRFLDLGCGIGRVAIPFAAMHPEALVVGVDISEVMLTQARGRRVNENVPNLAFVETDGRCVPPRLGPFDGAWSVLMFQHIPGDAQAAYVASVAEQLRPGGRFVFQGVEGDDDAFLSRHWQLSDVEAWCDAAGLRLDDYQRGLVYPTWAWAVAVRP